MQRSRAEKFVTLFDTAKRVSLMIDRLYGRLEGYTSTLAANSEDRGFGDNVIDLFITVHGLVDHLNRFLEIAQAMPILKKSAKQLVNLNRAIQPVKDARNYLQHLRGDLLTSDRIRFPVLGSISWIHDRKNFTLLPNQTTSGYGTSGIAFDTVNNTYACRYQLSLGGHIVRVDHAYSAVQEFWSWLNSVAAVQPASVKDYKWGMPAIIVSYVEDGSQ